MFENLQFKSLDRSTWKDFETLFGPRGACGGCWCMTWRVRRAVYERQKGEGNKQAIKALAFANEPIGIIAYEQNNPVGWCAIAPRDKYSRLENSRILKRIDERSVWSVVCFFVPKQHRRKGLSLRMLQAAIAFAASNGAKTIEAYPQIPKKDKIPDVFAFTGLASVFYKAGFKEVIRRSETRPIVRLILS